MAFVRDYFFERHLHKIVRIVYIALIVLSYLLRKDETSIAHYSAINRIVFPANTRKPHACELRCFSDTFHLWVWMISPPRTYS